MSWGRGGVGMGLVLGEFGWDGMGMGMGDGVGMIEYIFKIVFWELMW